MILLKALSQNLLEGVRESTENFRQVSQVLSFNAEPLKYANQPLVSKITREPRGITHNQKVAKHIDQEMVF
jgi:hypothetical protein